MVYGHRQKHKHKKRHGDHHPTSSKKYQKVYWPYLPLLVSIIISLFISDVRPLRPNQAVLAYATEMSISGLLQSTNQRRAENGASALGNNSKLNQAAQSKANDMASRDYWSHNTPEGDEPWVFVDAAGYSYFKAGENLAYGFTTSPTTITGWMNSPSHKANMLDTEFIEVGFGFANSSNYQDSGPQTVVVAMYGKPQVLAESQSASQPTPPPPAPAAPQPAQPQETQAVEEPAQTPSGQEQKLAVDPEKKKPVPTNTEQKTGDEVQQEIAQSQTITGGKLPWAPFAVGLISGAAVLAMLLKHAAALRHLIKNSEKLILHHPLLDSILISLVLLGVVLSRTTGVIL